MATKSKPVDDLTNLLANAFGAAKGVGDEVKALGRARAERLVADLDLVGRDEFEAFREMTLKLKAENEAQAKKIKALEAKVKTLKAK